MPPMRAEGETAVQLTIAIEKFPLRNAFTISRGSKTEAVVVTVKLSDGSATGWAECVPYPRYGESPESVVAAIEAQRDALENGLSREELQNRMKPGAARNAVDCALWDYEAKRSGVRAYQAAGLDRWAAATTAYTISLGSPEKMAEDAAKAADRPILKIKLGSPDGDFSRIAAVRRAAPNATLIADANEGWTEDNLAAHVKACADQGYALVEQPLPAAKDGALANLGRTPVLICADESVHDRSTLGNLVGLYDTINIKLDKTGGLTEALAIAKAAEERGLSIMVGSMVCSSLGAAPAMILSPRAKYVDLDGPLLVAKDRETPLCAEGSVLFPPEPALWG